MRAPNWTSGISAGLLVVGVIAVVRLSQNPSMRKGPQTAFSDYSAQVAKRFTDQMKEPAVKEMEMPQISSYVPPPAPLQSNALVGAPAPKYPVCGTCGGDSRFCRHSAQGAALMQGTPPVARVTSTPVTTTWDAHFEQFFPRPQW